VPAGQAVRVVHVAGLTLHVRALEDDAPPGGES
jgi:hypothetical protein